MRTLGLRLIRFLGFLKKRGPHKSNYCELDNRICPTMYETYSGDCCCYNRCQTRLLGQQVLDTLIEIQKSQNEKIDEKK